MSTTVEKCRGIAQAWRAENPSFANRGFVVIDVMSGQVSGWVFRLDRPAAVCPGVCACSVDGAIYEARGGNDYDGADTWERLQ